MSRKTGLNFFWSNFEITINKLLRISVSRKTGVNFFGSNFEITIKIVSSSNSLFELSLGRENLVLLK